MTDSSSKTPQLTNRPVHDPQVRVVPAGGRFEVVISWKESPRARKYSSVGCGHRHKDRWVAEGCAGTWRRRIEREYGSVG